MTQRVITYIDGFNLYYGLKEKNWNRYYWLDIRKLSENLLKPHQELVGVKYFTARVSGGEKKLSPSIRKVMSEKQKRQAVYLDALSTLRDLQIFEGSYLAKIIECHNCKRSWFSPEEKMTDVNIATELLVDAYEGNFDTALLISGDSDLVPPIRIIRDKFPSKRIIAAFPPERVSQRLQNNVHGYFVINEIKFRKSQFSDEVPKPDGYILKRPKEWI